MAMAQCKLLLVFITILVLHCNSQQNYFIDNRTDCNNVYDATNSEYVRFLGKYSSTIECIQACLQKSTSNDRCESYSYYNKQFMNETYATNCYGRFGSIYGILWTPIEQQNVDCGRIIYECKSDFDCEFNGKCDISTGNCTCDKAWSGYHCQQLNLKKAISANGYHIINDTSNGYLPTSSWGGTVLIDKSDQNENTKYHMWVSEFDNHCGVNSWSLNSVVTHAQSTNGFNSPYKRVEVVHSHFAHEVNAIYGPNGEIVLYYAAYNFTGVPECVCKDGSTGPECKTAGYRFINFMQYSPSGSVNGPWIRTVVFPNKPVNSGDTNLNGIILDNGTFIGFMRYITGNGSILHLVQSDNWKDGSSYIIHDELLFPQLIRLSAEDPYLYQDCNGGFHAILHNESPGDLQVLCGGHAWSENGIDWIYGGSSYGNTVQFTDGSNVTFTRRERPHFILADDGCTPLALTTGSQYGGKYGDATYTLLQEIVH